ncbi:cupin domain-containing protein [Marinobacterium rhizophilum]|uniref:Cupin domain-containing protein n=1 Tax=Marinobacterium rhizophilum TaxID=420402 RepID=A0ABY5HLM3_9GAMM|nr:cupin domain-containing protein [Marinobacterium rhizophilum]UTW12791.1 cupin domain-containing protein [Marinobacterium rhizophilum]
MSDFITVMRETCPTPVVDATKWTRIGGDPHTVNLNAYLSADGSKIMGTWICTPGKFEVNYDKWEFCHFLEGYCIITPEGEAPVHLKGGDVFVIEPGMKGTWEVVETVRKYFVFA